MHTIYNMRRAWALLGVAALLITSCDNRRLGTIEGTISGADGQLLVLEHLTDVAPRMVDTLRLDEKGSFRFRPEVEEGPDFFSLRLGNQSVSLVIDTLLTPVQVKADASNFISGYEVSGAHNQELKEAVQLGNRLRGQILAVNQAFNQGQLSRQASRDSILSLVGSYKQQVLHDYIYVNPSSPTSYYLLFETVQGLTIFDANATQDFRAFGAVSTGWDFNYKSSPRNSVLKKMTLLGQARRRAEKARAERADSIASQVKIETRTYPELNLTDADDHPRSLTSVVEGSGLVLVDFSAYYLDYSPAHNMALSGLYEKYSKQGMQIYQVCLDYDEHFWKTSADNLPWVTVRDRNVVYDQQGTIQYSAAALTYNVSSLPTTFIINKDGDLVARVEGDDARLEAELKKIIK